MLTPEQLAAARQKIGIQAPPDPAIANRNSTLDAAWGAPKVEKPNPVKPVVEGVVDIFKDRGEKAVGIAEHSAEKYNEETNPFSKARVLLESGLRQAGNVAGTVGDFIAKPLEAGIDAVSDLPTVQRAASHPAVSKALDEVNKGVSTATDAWKKFETEHPELAKDIGSAASIATLFPLGKAAQAGTKAAEETAAHIAKNSEKVAQFGADATKAGEELLAPVAKKVGQVVAPKATPGEAMGEILQGKPKDVTSGFRAVASKNADGTPVLDLKGVKTYEDFSKRLDTGIKNLSRKVDSHLAQDHTPHKLDELVVTTKTPAGTAVTTNHVEKALNDLVEMYDKTGEATKKVATEELLATAKKDGLTYKQVNDIARDYNIEFGKKAFGKTGEPLTSVNAQAYENTRTGVKETARKGMGGTEAVEADKVISSLYDTKTLVDKNVLAVNKLMQRIHDRGLIEKVGYLGAKYLDLLTGHSIRGFVGGILPRGVGNKVMNALDLQEHLGKNLKIIQKAAESGSNADIQKAMKVLADDPIKSTGNFAQVGEVGTSPFAIAEEHITSAKQIIENLPKEEINALGGMDELISRAKINMVDGLKAEGFVKEAKLLDALDAAHFKTIEQFDDAVRKTFEILKPVPIEMPPAEIISPEITPPSP